ncbi:LCS1 [Auxenochlorella protothecoides x Auxenochlorella symbiontica]
MSSLKHVGPLTVEVTPGRPEQGDTPAVSAVYRNVAAAEKFTTTVDGSTTLYEIFKASAEKHADQKCLGWRPRGSDGKCGPYKWLTYKETQDKAYSFAAALQKLGFEPHDKLGIYSSNNVEHMLTLKAVDVISAVVVPIYDSLGDTAVEYIVGHAEVRAIVVEEKKVSQLAKVANGISKLVRDVIVIGEPGSEAAPLRDAGIEVHGFAALVDGASASDVAPHPPAPSHHACIMYTSGTTGTPKGVVHTQASMTAVIAGVVNLTRQGHIPVTHDDSTLSYLTLAHIFGRVVEEFALSRGASIGYWQGDVKALMDDLKELRPTLFIAVPRILERVADGVRKKVAAGPALSRVLFNAAFTAKRLLLKTGLSHGLAGLGGDQVVFSRVRQAMGGRVRFIVSGGAPLSPEVEDFANVALAPVLQGYGLTETCAASFLMIPDPRLAYSVGPPLSANEFRLESVKELNYSAEDSPPKGEVCIRGPMLFQGYYKDEKKTKEDMDADGFFHTGDIGTLTPQGALKVIDRKKNIFKLAQGEYIAVEHLENVYNRSDALEQIWVHGESTESQLIAVVIPAKDWLKENGGKEALNKPEAKKAMVEELSKTAKANKLKGFEFVRAVHLDDEPWTPENNLLTPSLKVKRPQLKSKYEAELKQLYKDLKSGRK